jgi:hypothetical protein
MDPIDLLEIAEESLQQNIDRLEAALAPHDDTHPYTPQGEPESCAICGKLNLDLPSGMFDYTFRERAQSRLEALRTTQRYENWVASLDSAKPKDSKLRWRVF